MSERRKHWQGYWQTRVEPQGLLLAQGALRRRAALETKRLPALSLERLARVLQTLPSKPTSWADGWRHAELRDLPAAARQELLDISRDIENFGTIPAQSRPAVATLLPKPGQTAERAICVFAILAQLWWRLREALA
jgi:hypothetical protein